MNGRHRRVGKGLTGQHRPEQHSLARLAILPVATGVEQMTSHQPQRFAGQRIR
jgi:hypothetical protein